MLYGVLWLKSVLEVGFYFFTWDLRSDLRAWFIYAPISYLFGIKSTFKMHNKCLYNLSVFPDNRGRWHQSVFYQVLAEIPLISYCKVFTNKRGLLFFTQFILRGILFLFFLHQNYLCQVLLIIFRFWFRLQSLLVHIACLQHSNNEPHYIIAGALSMFPREDVFPILSLGSVRGNTVPREVFLCTLPRAQGLYWIIWSL